MAALIPFARKRSRSSEEEEFLPLSKKINNLHINQWQTHNVEDLPGQGWASKYPEETLRQAQQQQPPPSWPPPYSPELSANENPFYFESNRLLFELYLTRMQRSTYN